MESKLEMCLSVCSVFVQYQVGLSLKTVFIFISFYNSDQVQVALWYTHHLWHDDISSVVPEAGMEGRDK